MCVYKRLYTHSLFFHPLAFIIVNKIDSHGEMNEVHAGKANNNIQFVHE